MERRFGAPRRCETAKLYFKNLHHGCVKELTAANSRIVLSDDEAAAEKNAARDYLSWDLTERQLCDIELLLNGAFSPLEGFLNRPTTTPLSTACGSLGVLWPMPITLDVSEDFADSIKSGDRIALRDLEGVIIATLEVGDIWTPTRSAKPKACSARPTRRIRPSTI